MMTEDDKAGFIFDLSIRVVHPKERVERVTSELGLDPTAQCQFGEPRRTPVGTALPGTYRDTRWSHCVRYKTHNEFFTVLQDLLERLEGAQEYLHGLTASGGQVSLNVNLAGHTRISDVLLVSDLVRMARIDVGLGVEIFPHMRA